MTDNYPPGAAYDPRAPYNEELPPEVEVTVKVTMTKETVVYAATHDCVEWEIDPDTGRREGIHFTEYDDIDEAYRNEEYTPSEIMTKCQKVCRQLKRDGHRWYAGVNIEQLADSCDGWEEDTLNVEH